VEAIKMAQSGGVPIVVAVNKCDVEGVEPHKIRDELLEYGVVSEEQGGDTIMVNISAKSGMGLPELEEAINLTAESLELKAPTDGVVEASVVRPPSLSSALLSSLCSLLFALCSLLSALFSLLLSALCSLRAPSYPVPPDRPVHPAHPGCPVQVEARVVRSTGCILIAFELHSHSIIIVF
jgi:hypothetical protein